MNYKIMVISRIEKNDKSNITIATLYPSNTVCIKPRPYEKIVASFMCSFQTELELAEYISEKGKKRLKLVMKRPMRTESERRELGSDYYSLLFGKHCGNDETQKGIADKIYYTMCDLYEADAESGDSWQSACMKATTAFQAAITKYHETTA